MHMVVRRISANQPCCSTSIRIGTTMEGGLTPLVNTSSYFFISLLFAGKVIEELEEEMRKEVLEKITDQEEKMIETFETKIANLSQGVSANAKAFEEKIEKKGEEQEKKIAEAEVKIIETLEMHIEALEEKIVEQEEIITRTLEENINAQEVKIANLSQGVTANAANDKAFKEKIEKKGEEQEKKIADNLGLIKAVSKEVATIEATVRDLPDICKSKITFTNTNSIQ